MSSPKQSNAEDLETAPPHQQNTTATTELTNLGDQESPKLEVPLTNLTPEGVARRG